MTYYPTNYRYDKKNRVKVTVGFNRKTEPELTDWMEEKENKSGYLKELAQKDMEQAKRQEKE
ncbi:hypothetical protein [Raoultibacter timonensis]|uniref:hypothetical protein n=1 Tax=Raoultibacter timonensis TaxID=1907662 RepID=UPI0026DD016C|nr:hypothetical protein [Raoultibacter timonensis]